jgi:hypothetical protein
LIDIRLFKKHSNFKIRWSIFDYSKNIRTSNFADRYSIIQKPFELQTSLIDIRVFKKTIRTSKFADRYSIIQKTFELQTSLIDIRVFKKTIRTSNFADRYSIIQKTILTSTFVDRHSSIQKNHSNINLRWSTFEYSKKPFELQTSLIDIRLFKKPF